MIDLPTLADRLQLAGLIQKSFLDCTKSEIVQVVEAVLSSFDSTVPVDGWDKPRIEDNSLIITFNSHPKYHWWTIEGQSILETLVELNAPWEVAKKYLRSKRMTEADYINRLTSVRNSYLCFDVTH